MFLRAAASGELVNCRIIVQDVLRTYVRTCLLEFYSSYVVGAYTICVAQGLCFPSSGLPSPGIACVVPAGATDWAFLLVRSGCCFIFSIFRLAFHVLFLLLWLCVSNSYQSNHTLLVRIYVARLRKIIILVVPSVEPKDTGPPTQVHV